MTSSSFKLANTRIQDGIISTPTVVLIHGALGTRHTWNGFMKNMEGRFNIIAVDLRGHGDSPLGPDEDFNANSITADIHKTLLEEGILFPVVVLGISMGGRIAIAFAALYPESVAALIIVDMDVRPRDYEDMDDDEVMARRNCPSTFTSFEEAENVLSPWFDEGMLSKWCTDGSGRMRENDDGTWTVKNTPHLQYLLRLRLLGPHGIGMTHFKMCAKATYHVFLMVATDGSSCDITSLEEMGYEVPRMETHFVYYSTHSVHRSCPDGFKKKFEELMARVAT
jgi:pimeloyl-ACP methyl ester carboxylesterase